MLDDQLCSLPHTAEESVCQHVNKEVKKCLTLHRATDEGESGSQGCGVEQLRQLSFPAVQLLGTVGQGHSIPGFLRWTAV